MEPTIKYSRTKFEGFTHRYRFEFKIKKEQTRYNIDIYTNVGSLKDVTDYINERKATKVESFKIMHIATRDQDQREIEFLEEYLNDKTGDFNSSNK